jgi:hypothetical protein
MWKLGDGLLSCLPPGGTSDGWLPPAGGNARRKPLYRLRPEVTGTMVGVMVLAMACGLTPARADAQVAPDAQVPAAPTSPQAQDLEQLRQELATLKREYEARIADLEQRLASLAPAAGVQAVPTPPPGETPAAPPATTPPEAAAPAPPVPETAAAPPPAPAGGVAQGLPESLPPTTQTGQAALSSKVFNPDIAVIGNILGAAGTNHVEDSPAWELNEAEASFQAVVDPYARGDVFFSVGPGGAEVEEGFITFTSLPGGLLLKAGKMRAQFGKVNTMHTHVLPWTDRPLVTRMLVGGDEGISDGGVSVSKLFPNNLLFLEATGEIYGGRSDVFAGSERSHVSYIGRLRGYRDLSEGTNLDVGTSFAFGHTDLEPDATRRLIGLDATFRYRPLRRAIYRRFIARTELVWNQDRLQATQPTVFGMYASGEYQFARRWFGGGRYDYSQRPLDSSLADTGGAATLTFWPSEFSQVRGQYRRTNYAQGPTANEFLFQFLFSIGAHGAHVF